MTGIPNASSRSMHVCGWVVEMKTAAELIDDAPRRDLRIRVAAPKPMRCPHPGSRAGRRTEDGHARRSAG